MDKHKDIEIGSEQTKLEFFILPTALQCENSVLYLKLSILVLRGDLPWIKNIPCSQDL